MRERSAAGGSSGGGLTMVTVGAVRRGVVNVVMRGARWLLLLKGGRRVVGVDVKRTKRKEGECSRRCECKSVFGCR